MKIFAKTVEHEVLEQLQTVMDARLFDNDKIKIMPDTHAGKGCVIGFTAPLQERIVPNLVGVDIGCGIMTYNIGKREIDYKSLDCFIKQNIPSGVDVRKDLALWDKVNMLDIRLADLRADFGGVDNRERIIDRAKRSIGTLGSGNHYIEIDEDAEGTKYLIVHCGSRNLGKEVCDFYQDKARKKTEELFTRVKTRVIESLKAEGRTSEIECELSKITKPNKDLEWLVGQDAEDYLHDMKICQRLAEWNRFMILVLIGEYLNVKHLHRFKYYVDIEGVFFDTVHNYINFDDNILRKGAIAAPANTMVTIGLNMRDGNLLCKGKGNADWNCSAPHGAGRLMSRTQAKKEVSMEDFKETMKGIYTSCISKETLDESPMAYKDWHEIVDMIEDTVEVVKHIKPIYNFKGV